MSFFVGKDWKAVDLERAGPSVICGPPQVNINLTWVPSGLPKAKRKLSWWLNLPCL